MSDSNEVQKKNKKRLLSIDALRGFDMFWIIGAEGVFAALFVITGWSVFATFAEQMKHTQWHGFTAYDLIFPLFIFLSGVSLGIAAKPLKSLPKDKAQQTLRHGVKRLLLLLVFGILYNHGWGTGVPVNPDDIRYVSVLGRIGISWFGAALLVWYVSERTQWITAIGVLVGYWLLLEFVTLGGFGGGDYSADGALNAWFDKHFLPGISYQNLTIDPEGILSNIPSVVNALIGVFVGRMMMKYKEQQQVVTRNLFVIGAGLLILGYAFDYIMPINKTLWTSSFVLVTTGYSSLLLAVFYWLIDVVGFKRWAVFFAVIGTNSIIVYLGSSLIDWKYISHSVAGGAIKALPNGWNELLLITVMVLLQWLVLHWLYRRKIFVKV